MRGSRRLRLLLVLLVLSAFTLTALDYTPGTSPLDALRRGADTLFGPAQRALGGAARTVGNAVGGLPSLGNQDKEVADLRRRNLELEAMLRQTDDLRRQKAEWDSLMQLKDFGTYTLVPAHLSAISRSFGFEWTATIDVGSRDGVQEGQTVVSGLGLVGRTKRVGPYTSVVILLLDKDFAVGSRLQRSASFGLATGDGGAGGTMTYELVGQNSEIRKGDVLLTAGSETFVPGVPVGRVTAIDGSANALTRTARVQPFVDVTALDLVGVIVQPPRGTPRIPIPPSPLPTPTSTPSPTPSPTLSPALSPTASPTPGPGSPPPPTGSGSPSPGASPTRTP